MNHLFKSLLRSQNVQKNQKLQSMIDVENLITYNDEKEQNSMTSSIILSSFYCFNVHESYEKKRNSLRTIQIHLSRRKRLNYNERIFFDSFLFSFVKLTAEKYARKKQYLFDTILWSLHFSKCFKIVMTNDTHVIFLLSAKKI